MFVWRTVMVVWAVPIQCLVSLPESEIRLNSLTVPCWETLGERQLTKLFQIPVPQDYKKELWLVLQHSTVWVTVSAIWLWKEKHQILIFFCRSQTGFITFLSRVYKHSKPLPRWPWPPNSSNPITWLKTQLLPKINRDKLQKWKQPSAPMVVPMVHWLLQNSHPAP